jgi:class 3 adenylate cyclase/pimeloyl-ACP methyl ester carboxylesterase
MQVPETRYAWNGDVALAYQLVGDGPMDLVYQPGFCSHIDMSWESPYLSAFLRGLARETRLIVTDRRGWGCYDRFSVTDVPPFETMVDDLLAVLDEAGSERAAIFATQECTPIACLFAAIHPDRTSGLVLCDPYVTYLWTEETPWMWTVPSWEETFREWHTTYPIPRWWSGPLDHPERRWFERFVRASVAPGALIAEIRRFMATDIRPVLPTVTAPTLVIVDPAGREDTDPRAGAFIAERMPQATLIEIEDPPASLGWLHWYGRSERIVAATGSFLATLRDQEAALDRVLATVLFTDIVDSTGKAAERGDRGWREVLERHHQIVRGLLARYRGTEIDTAGDGFFATFDGPARAARCALAIAEAVRPLGIEIRAGVHTGEIELDGEDVRGIAIHIGARVGSLAGPSQVLVSSTVRDLVAGSGLVFEDAGEHELKGVPDRWHLYRVVG